jgi:crotonobetainyl-CoA:carnitine CoA-transferase CaiB-like acyl-CoA transferase
LAGARVDPRAEPSDAPEPAAGSRPGLLSGIRVLDLSPLYAGAMAAALLADLGAEVIAVEHPVAGSPMRTMLPQKDGESIWWKVMGRGKRAITIDLSTDGGQDLARRLASGADLLFENFRPGTLERWNLGPADLEQVCERLVMVRISGYGQTGPLKDRPGYGTVAEAMSGFAHLNGEPDQPPVFPSVSLADGIAATFGAFGALSALVGRQRAGATGVQVVDVALFETLFRLIPLQIPTYDQLGIALKRPGNFLGSHGVLRNLYETADGVYFIVSAIGPEPIRRVLVGAGADELANGVRDAVKAGGKEFEAFLDRANEHVKAWAAAELWETVSVRLNESGAVSQRVYDAAAIVEDEHFQARGDLVSVPDPSLGSVMMPGIVPKFPGYEHTVTHAGPPHGQHSDEVLREVLGLDDDAIARLREASVI